MPRKTKETEKLEDTTTKKTKAKKLVEKTKSKKTVGKAKAKKSVEKKASNSKTLESKSKVSTAKKVASTKSSATKVATKKASTKKTTSAKSSATKVAAKKTSTKKATSSKPSVKKVKTAKATKTVKKTTVRKKYSPEYYDLPFRYNKTIVTLLAQTPTNIFVYWEISDKDRENLKKQYGEYFFEITKPVLIIHNLTKKYSFEIDINDFANSWYIEVEDSNCKYEVELGRRPIEVNYSYIPNYDIEKNGPIYPLNENYIYISSSNDLVVPNDHVLFNWSNKIYFKNVKTSEITAKDISDFSFIDSYGKIISIYELFRKEFGDYYLGNPSSGNPSSGSFSSSFK